MSEPSYQIGIIGAGALGATYGSLLYQYDPGAVCFLAGGGRYDQLSRNGVNVNGRQYQINVVQPHVAAAADLVIVAVKHHQLDQAISEMASSIGTETTILSVMNGIESEERIGATYGMDKVLYGLALGIDAVRVDGAVAYSNLGRVLFGEANNRVLSERVRRIQALFDAAGIPSEVPVDMLRSLWFKFMVNVGVNQVSAVRGATYGTLRRSAEAKKLMDAAMLEVVRIAQARGIGLSERDLETWYGVLATLGEDGKTSMLQDVEAGRKTELEMLAGTVIALGQQHDIAVPVNRQLFVALKQLEAAAGGRSVRRRA